LHRLREQRSLEFFSGLRITAITREGDALTVDGLDGQGKPVQVPGIDEIICAAGQRPDLKLAAELRLKVDPWLESTEALGPLIDPNLHSCGTVRPHGHRELSHPEAGFYTVGVKSYGRAPTFLMATGFEQVRSVVAAIDSDVVAADRVELDLPETGVCSTAGSTTEGLEDASCCATSELAAEPASAAAPRAGCGTSSCGTAAKATAPVLATTVAATAATRCCGGPAKADTTACCALDEAKKAEGAAGCGCADAPPKSVAATAATASCCT